MSGRIIIVDFGMGNLFSVRKKILRIGIDAVISSMPGDIASADKIILPGVGHFKVAMENLQKLNLIGPLNEFALVKQKPVLGICLGMQLMAKESEEGNVEGLGWMDAGVVRFKISDKIKYKVPHIGWNTVSIKKNSSLMKKIDQNSEFYFVHAYHWKGNDTNHDLNETTYEYAFTSGVEKENLFGVQYHPEKSHRSGEQLLKNFILL